MKKFTMLAFLGAAAFGFVAVEATTTVAAAAEKEEKKLSPETLKAKELYDHFQYLLSGKAGNRMRRFSEYISGKREETYKLLPKISVIAKEDPSLKYANHLAWTYAEMVNRGAEPLEGVEVRDLVRKYDFFKFVREFATEEELKDAVPAEALKAKGVAITPANNADLNAFKAAANRLGEDSIVEAAQKKIDAAKK
ncbi:MAG: hypothetical protein LBR07_01560 [Puniceicoccales bacterium]|jgi:hypothetical protein|nr:hypothetical protein [Puniceicoccales bacterium]